VTVATFVLPLPLMLAAWATAHLRAALDSNNCRNINLWCIVVNEFYNYLYWI